MFIFTAFKICSCKVKCHLPLVLLSPSGECHSLSVISARGLFMYTHCLAPNLNVALPLSTGVAQSVLPISVASCVDLSD